MRGRLRFSVCLLLLTSLPAAAAESPQVLLQRMKAWLEPNQPGTRQLTMLVRSGAESVEWTAAQARGSRDGGRFALTVLLAPPDLRGTALLVEERDGKPNREWLYLPYLRRVREVLPADEFEAFLNTEFTYADLGFVGLRERTLKLLGPDTVDGVAAVKVQETPKDQRPFRRIVTWLVPATGQPLKREYYDVADRLWKVETFQDVADIHGVPTPQRVRMEDVQTGFGSEYRATRIAYGVTLPPALFDPAQLSKAADSPAWK